MGLMTRTGLPCCCAYCTVFPVPLGLPFHTCLLYTSSLISDIQERIQLIGSKGYEHKARLTTLKEAARTLNYLTENNLLQYADLEKKVEDVYKRQGSSQLLNAERPGCDQL